VVEHLAVLGLLGVIFTELGLYGVQKIPFTCSYLPGKSNFNMTFLLLVGFIFNVIAKAVQFERKLFEDARGFATLIAILIAIAICMWWRTTMLSRSPEGELQFEDAADPAIFALDLHRDGMTPMPPRRDTH
jgi:hypothetical protein